MHPIDHHINAARIIQHHIAQSAKAYDERREATAKSIAVGGTFDANLMLAMVTAQETYILWATIQRHCEFGVASGQEPEPAAYIDATRAQITKISANLTRRHSDAACPFARARDSATRNAECAFLLLARTATRHLASN